MSEYITLIFECFVRTVSHDNIFNKSVQVKASFKQTKPKLKRLDRKRFCGGELV